MCAAITSDSFSLWIRRQITDHGRSYNLRKDQTLRASVLKRYKADQSINPTVTTNALTWSTLTQGAATKFDKIIRRAWKDLCALVNIQYSGDDAYTSQALWIIYHSLAHDDADTVRAQLGPVKSHILERMHELVSVLYTWRGPLTVDEPIPVLIPTYSIEFDGNGWDRIWDTLEVDSYDPLVAHGSHFEQECYDGSWLVAQCGDELLAMTVIDILNRPSSEMELQESLFTSLGETRIELIFEIMSHLDEIRDATSSFSSSASATVGSSVSREVRSVAAGVSISTASEKQAAKHQRKLEKKLRKLGIDTRKPEPDSQSTEDYLPKKSFGSKESSGLPSGTERIKHKGWEEVIVPPKNKLSKQNDQLLDITVLDKMGQIAFKGVTKLNALQTSCFEVAYNSNENILVAAPTGAGKTNVAMLTVLREIREHVVGGVLQSDMFKIVYVAPMKALAQEIVEKFGRRLSALGISVRELTGDMQLSKKEIQDTQMIVTTPEKWDVITRKSGDGAGGGGSGEGSVAGLVRLLIIDEVHLLHEERGAVLEALVARTIRQVEVSQRMIRIVGLSATLPNYMDVAQFLRVNPGTGLLRFDASHRPVPLKQVFIGVDSKNQVKSLQLKNEICFEKTLAAVSAGHQVMVFVHSRRDTAKTAEALVLLAKEAGRADAFSYIHQDSQIDSNLPGVFDARSDAAKKESQKDTKITTPKRADSLRTHYRDALIKLAKCQSREVKSLFQAGFGIHHAGMVRSDRKFVETSFAKGHLQVICCTATLAWGVNLPAHCVIIKGTDVYNSKKGGFVDLSMLDVMQIFGRAGRPQFNDSGDAIIITSRESLPRYLALLTNQLPIESTFITALPDNLNAEICSGTVTNLREALAWLSYTFLYIRMVKNPIAYGISFEELNSDPTLFGHRKTLILYAAKQLMECKMIRFDARSGNFFSTELGRTCSHYYLHHLSVLKYNPLMHEHMTDDEIFHLLAVSKEFEQIKVRDDELNELDKLKKEYCFCKVTGGVEFNYGKANALLQMYIGRASFTVPSLISDSLYITQSAGRICRALFRTCLTNGWSGMAQRLLVFSKMIEHRVWWFETPLRQMPSMKAELSRKIELKDLHYERLRDMTANDIGGMLKNRKSGECISKLVSRIPRLDLEVTVKPLTRSVVRLFVSVYPEFEWNDRMHGGAQMFILWVEDANNEYLYHSEEFLLKKTDYLKNKSLELEWAIPIFEPIPPQYFVRSMSQNFLGGDSMVSLPFRHLVLPEAYPPHTSLLDLDPLPVTCLQNHQFESLYLPHFKHFNPMQTQCFHVTYHSDENLLIGAPTGSGKTLVADLSILRLLNEHPSKKTVYIAPLKALARQRLTSWKKSFGNVLGKRVVMLTGDVTPNLRELNQADIVITTPEKWDGISRSWRSCTRTYVQQVGLVIIDEIHLLGQDRGPILEVIVSRMRFMAAQLQESIRVVGLSTALANSNDLADWLGVSERGLFNFHPSVRPVPVTVHISGFTGKHYCPRMATMNKPTYAAITTYSPEKPVLVFVSSRRQTRLTAFDLIFYCAAEANPRRFNKMTDIEWQLVSRSISDDNLRHTLEFGIGLHHAGLRSSDRELVEKLFLENKIQILVCTATLAWGVNLPAHLVVVKGTEYFDPNEGRYVDMPLTDVLQMIGRAGRPQFDTSARACLFVHEPKKNFYRKFLYEPFPVESSLVEAFPAHLNAEIVGGVISSFEDAVEYLSWTFFFRRLTKNPSYYKDVDDNGESLDMAGFLLEVISDALRVLESCNVVEIDWDSQLIVPTYLGKIASYYYLSHESVSLFHNTLEENMEIKQILEMLCEASEYNDIPVRHNEEKANEKLAMLVLWDVGKDFESPHVKTNLLIQARFSELSLPIADYYTDTKSVLDQSIRVLQAMIDVSSESGYLTTTLAIMHFMQMIIQGQWRPKCDFDWIPAITKSLSKWLKSPAINVNTLASLVDAHHNGRLDELLGQFPPSVNSNDIDKLGRTLDLFPVVELMWTLDRNSVHVAEDIKVSVKSRRVNRGGTDAYCPKWRKKDEGWWLMISLQSGELLALTRINVNYRRYRQSDLYIVPPEAPGVYKLNLHLVSDTYIGLDQEHSFKITVKEQ